MEPITGILNLIGTIASVIGLSESDTVKNFLLAGKHIIPIIGAGGTGKTTLANSLLGKDPTYEYIETPVIDKEKLNRKCFIWIAPGQEERVKTQWREIKQIINDSDSNVLGIINMVSYGYHSIDDSISSYKDTKYYKSNPKNFEITYLSEKRKDEINRLNVIKSSLVDSEKPPWMITFVNKQDLWWDKKDEVIDYYENGPYSKALQPIIDEHGNRFRHEIVYCATQAVNLKIGTDFQFSTVEGYDETLRSANFEKFLTLFQGVIKK